MLRKCSQLLYNATFVTTACYRWKSELILQCQIMNGGYLLRENYLVNITSCDLLQMGCTSHFVIGLKTHPTCPQLGQAGTAPPNEVH